VTVTEPASGDPVMHQIRYEFTVTLDAGEELSDASKDALAAALARAIPGARMITCARAGPVATGDNAVKAIHERPAPPETR
jgi:hypothetical protein